MFASKWKEKTVIKKMMTKNKIFKWVLDILAYFIIILVISMLFNHFGIFDELHPVFYAVCMTIGWTIGRGIISIFKGRRKNNIQIDKYGDI